MLPFLFFPSGLISLVSSQAGQKLEVLVFLKFMKLVCRGFFLVSSFSLSYFLTPGSRWMTIVIRK